MYLLMLINRFTRWPETIPIVHITAVCVVEAFVSGWIARFGIPSTIITNRGGQFESGVWIQFAHLLGLQRICTTSYRHIVNGIIERKRHDL